jgi:hypothetical protein
LIDSEYPAPDPDYVPLYRMLELAKGQPRFQPYSLARQVVDGKSNVDRLVNKLRELLSRNWYRDKKSRTITPRLCGAAQSFIEDCFIGSCLTPAERRILDAIEDINEKLQNRANEVAAILGKPPRDLQEEWIASLYAPDR